MSTGIEARHARSCALKAGGARCTCTPTWQASVGHGSDRIRKTLPTKSAAKLWRQDALVAMRRGSLTEARPKTTVEEASATWLEAARAGIVRTRSGDAFKPATLRRYEQALRLAVYPTLGTAPFYRLRRRDLQDLADRLTASGAAPSTIKTTFGALGAIYARSVQRDELDVSPVAGVKTPTVRNGRIRFASRQEAAALIAATPERDRAVWAAAVYSGLRRGELMALRWQDVDLPGGTLLVARGWDENGPTTTKSSKDRRVPIIPALREHLVAQRLRQPPGVELVFGQTSARPFRADRLQERADGAWSAAGLERLTLHDCRHTYASLCIAAGINAKALQTFMGHATIKETFDRYGHLMPGSEAEAAGLLDTYLEATG